MEETPADIVTALTNVAALVVIVGGVYVWVTIFRCLRRRCHPVPFEPRRPVPWGGLDLLLVLFGYVCLGGLLVFAATDLLGWELHDFQAQEFGVQQADTLAEETQPVEDQESSQDEQESDDELDLDRAHPVVVLLSGDASPGTFLLCLFTVVIMAPVAEEFFFRLLLQGYLEKVDFRWQRMQRYSARTLGLMPILVSSVLFASLHAREPETPRAVELLIRLFMLDSLTKLFLVTGAIAYLKTVRGASWTDLGLRFDTFWEDLRLAFSAYLAVVVPIYVLQEGLSQLFPDSVPDPVPLFCLAVALGYLYFRTHRLMPAILLHLIFNATALVMFFAVTAGP